MSTNSGIDPTTTTTTTMDVGVGSSGRPERQQFEHHHQQRQKLTVLIASYKQPKCLNRLIQHFQQCSSVVHSIHVNLVVDDYNNNNESILHVQQQAQQQNNEYYSNTITTNNNSNNSSSISSSSSAQQQQQQPREESGGNKQKTSSSVVVPVVVPPPPPEVVYTVVPNTLYHRFTPNRTKPIITDAIFHVDIDWGYSCELLQYALDVWYNNSSRGSNNNNEEHNNNDSSSNSSSSNTPQQQKKNYNVVGFHPRKIYSNGMYAWDESLKPPYQFNTMLVTNGGITHRDLLNEYFNNIEYKMFHNKIQEYKTAEDLLMSYMIANKTRIQQQRVVQQQRLQQQQQQQQHTTIKNSQLTFICPKSSHHMCEVTCNDNNVKPLSGTTSNRRPRMIRLYHNYFGSLDDIDKDSHNGSDRDNNGGVVVDRTTYYSMLWQQDQQEQQRKRKRSHCLPVKCSHDFFNTATA